VLSFVVGTDGLVHDPIIDDSSGVPAFERRALQMFEGWRYEPATWNGKPVEQAKTKTRIIFSLKSPQNSRGASEKFVRRERKFNRLLKSGDLEGAGELLKSTFQQSGWNLYETTRLWLASYRLHAAYADDENQLKSIRRASTGRQWVRPETAISILRVKLALEVRLTRIADALETYELIISEAPDLADSDPLVEAVKKIRDIVDGDPIIATEALIEKSAWQHILLRQKFSIDTVDGEIANVDIRCDWHRAKDGMSDIVKVWEIPASWGDCRLYVRGEEGTTFRLLELPNE